VYDEKRMIKRTTGKTGEIPTTYKLALSVVFISFNKCQYRDNGTCFGPLQTIPVEPSRKAYLMTDGGHVDDTCFMGVQDGRK
jgi:hypothetical protein